MSTYRIASFDGGGIRGLLSSTIAQRLEIANPGCITTADMLAGTSTGGIIALALASGMTPADVSKLYHDNGAAIFSVGLGRKLLGADGLNEAKYSNEGLKAVLQSKFGNKKIGDLKQKVVIPTLALYADNPPRQKPVFITNLDPRTSELYLWQAALMTSAAPTYFPTFGSFVDGGTVANDPAACAVIRALRDGGKLGLRSERSIRVLSIGTGAVYKPIAGQDHDAGLLWWAPKLADLFLDGNVELAEEMLTELLAELYCRINPNLGTNPIGLDDVGRVDDLVKLGMQADLGNVSTWISKYFTDAPDEA